MALPASERPSRREDSPPSTNRRRRTRRCSPCCSGSLGMPTRSRAPPRAHGLRACTSGAPSAQITRPGWPRCACTPRQARWRRCCRHGQSAVLVVPQLTTLASWGSLSPGAWLHHALGTPRAQWEAAVRPKAPTLRVSTNPQAGGGQEHREGAAASLQGQMGGGASVGSGRWCRPGRLPHPRSAAHSGLREAATTAAALRRANRAGAC